MTLDAQQARRRRQRRARTKHHGDAVHRLHPCTVNALFPTRAGTSLESVVLRPASLRQCLVPTCLPSFASLSPHRSAWLSDIELALTLSPAPNPPLATLQTSRPRFVPHLAFTYRLLPHCHTTTAAAAHRSVPRSYQLVRVARGSARGVGDVRGGRAARHARPVSPSMVTAY